MTRGAPSRRHDHYESDPASVRQLGSDNQAVREGRTVFISRVFEADAVPRLLISGANQRKIGDGVTKGAWAGMPIYTLTLEERATCPVSCMHWRSCMGNNMHWSRRVAAGPKLEYLLPIELADLQDRHRGGFVVRLHILGDFYDAAYAMLWARWLDQFPALRIFGYTARPATGGIGAVIRHMNYAEPGRCVIRFSVAELSHYPDEQLEATTIWKRPFTPQVDGAIVCPSQTGRTDCCGTCALCWSTTKPIAFIAHGNPRRGPGKDDSDT